MIFRKPYPCLSTSCVCSPMNFSTPSPTAKYVSRKGKGRGAPQARTDAAMGQTWLRNTGRQRAWSSRSAELGSQMQQRKLAGGRDQRWPMTSGAQAPGPLWQPGARRVPNRCSYHAAGPGHLSSHQRLKAGARPQGQDGPSRLLATGAICWCHCGAGVPGASVRPGSSPVSGFTGQRGR